MLTIDYRSGESLYIQIKNNYKKMIMSGSLKENEMLPSVRTLAGNLAINVNTVQRAYRELEQEGYLYSKSGLGTYVSATDKATQLRADELIHEFDDIVMELVYLATPPDILKSRIDKIGERGNK